MRHYYDIPHEGHSFDVVSVIWHQMTFYVKWAWHKKNGWYMCQTNHTWCLRKMVHWIFTYFCLELMIFNNKSLFNNFQSIYLAIIQVFIAPWKIKFWATDEFLNMELQCSQILSTLNKQKYEFSLSKCISI